MHDGELILIAGALLAGGLLASLVAGRVRVPSLLLFLGLGMLVGSDGLDLIHFGDEFEDYELARSIGIIALSLILFEGGLNSGLSEIRPVLGASISLATVGTAVTALIAGVTAMLLFDFSTLEGLLVGAVLASTDGAAIFALLRNSTLRRRLARTLEGESGMNDPVAVVLMLACIEAITDPEFDGFDAAALMVGELGIGLVIGLAVGWLAVQGFRRAQLATPGLYPVASLATAALAYGGADVAHGSGFLAVYLSGLVLGTATVPARQTVAAFHQGLGWVAQLTMFTTLGLLVFPAQLDDVALEGTILALVVLFVARPAAVLVATLPIRYSLRERLVLDWAGLRGAVPVVLAIFPVIEGVEGSLELFNIVFFAVLLSTLLQGATFESVARRLGMTTNTPALPRPLAEAGTIRRLGAEVLEYPIAPGDAIAGAAVRDLGLPRDAVVNVIVRGDQAIPPRGSTRLRPGDRLHVLLRSAAARQVPVLLDRWRDGPIGPPPRPPREIHGRRPVFSSWRWREEEDGDPEHVREFRGVRTVEQLRIRRDRPGGLWVLADGRYGLSGPLGAMGSRSDLTQWARRR
ncbi:MAG TPA: potassium/proton antiporter, partial [Solirubrobacteraceae bacterium]|nr:potassium/proton antiporter [Solirubrobacteraceae bacterium]